jgi:hypothetical protein
MRSTTNDAARRAQTSIARATIREIDDDHLMQQVKGADVMHDESPTDFESFQSIGFTTVPKKQSQSQSGQGSSRDFSGGNGGSGTQQPQGESAEAMMIYPGGNRSHPVCVGIDDRRVRPYGLKEGESMHYSADGSGQCVYHRTRGDSSDGLYMLTCDGPSEGGKASQTRYVSCRHVQKPQQRRTQQQSSSRDGSQRGGQLPDGSQSNYKHEGETVNVETRHTATQIAFYDGSNSVGQYDKTKQQWNLNIAGKGSMVADKDHAHIAFGKMVIWVDKDGCWSSQPIQIKDDPYDKSSSTARRPGHRIGSLVRTVALYVTAAVYASSPLWLLAMWMRS